MASSKKPLLITFLAASILTAAYFAILAQLPAYSMARGNFGIWGFVGYLALVSLLGFLLTGKSSHKMALCCATGIPCAFTLAIFIVNNILYGGIRIPTFNQYGDYYESLAFAMVLLIVMIMRGGGLIFVLSAALCGLREDKKQKRKAAAGTGNKSSMESVC